MFDQKLKTLIFTFAPPMEQCVVGENLQSLQKYVTRQITKLQFIDTSADCVYMNCQNGLIGLALLAKNIL